MKTETLKLKTRILSIPDKVFERNKQLALLWIFKYMKQLQFQIHREKTKFGSIVVRRILSDIPILRTSWSSTSLTGN
jgi:hypothetical protein